MTRSAAAHLFLLAFFLNCSSPQQAQSSSAPAHFTELSDAEMKTLSISLTRTACMGDCPEYSVRVWGDGRVEYEGFANVKTVKKRQSQLAADKVRALLAEFDKDKFWEIDPIYSEAGCTGTYCFDWPSTTIEVTIGGASHRIEHFYGCAAAPKSLFKLEKMVDETANVQQWTGDVSKSGPMATTCVNRPKK
jgi:hypothetical protein